MSGEDTPRDAYFVFGEIILQAEHPSSAQQALDDWARNLLQPHLNAINDQQQLNDTPLTVGAVNPMTFDIDEGMQSSLIHIVIPELQVPKDRGGFSEKARDEYLIDLVNRLNRDDYSNNDITLQA